MFKFKCILIVSLMHNVLFNDFQDIVTDTC